MLKVLVLAVALMACVSCAPAGDEGICAGCPMEQNVNDPEIKAKVQGVLAQANSPFVVKRIISYKTQVVAGKKHIVEFEGNDNKRCEITWVDQPWVSPDPQYVKVNC